MSRMCFLFCLAFAVNLSAITESTAGPSGQLYLIHIELTGSNLLRYFNRTTAGRVTSGDARVIHRFKVVGQDDILLVVEEGSLDSVDKFVQNIPKRFGRVKSSTPLLAYEKFASFLGVCPPDGDAIPLTNGRFFWMDFTVTHPELTTEELKSLWAKEATTALDVTRQSELRPYKVVGERKIHAFVKYTAEQADAMSWNLPMMVENGNGVKIVTKAVNKF